MPSSPIHSSSLGTPIHKPYISYFLRIISFMHGRLGLPTVSTTAVIISRSNILLSCYSPTYCSKQSPAANLKAYFSIIKQYLTKRWHNKRDKFQNIVDEVLRKILECTIEVEKLRKEVGVYLRPTTAGDAGNLDIRDVLTHNQNQSDKWF
jgi:hypothetical protein